MLLPLTLAQVYTAATLWCTAAIGVLCSVGLLLEATLGSLMLHSLSDPGLRLQSLHSEDLPDSVRLEVRAQLLGNAQAAAQLERLVSRVSLEKGVSAVRWQVRESAAD